MESLNINLEGEAEKNAIYGRLKKYEKLRYRITHPKNFEPIEAIQTGYVYKCLEFSYDMAFGNGEHRNYRSGGNKKRRSGEIFANVFQGKLAEYGMYQFLLKNGMDSREPDLSVMGLGKWDAFDLECNGRLIAVKSTKYYGQLLLLETADWDSEGHYIPNMGKEGEMYDSIVLMRIKPSSEIIMKTNRMLYIDDIEKTKLLKMFSNYTWEYDIAGFIINADLKRLIDKGYILPKEAILNDNTMMDAENYYVQANDMRRDTEFVKRMLTYTEKLNETK